MARERDPDRKIGQKVGFCNFWTLGAIFGGDTEKIFFDPPAVIFGRFWRFLGFFRLFDPGVPRPEFSTHPLAIDSSE